MLDPLRHVGNPQFGGVIFRRTSPQIRNEGGLWDESTNIYPLLKAEPKESMLEWSFPSGSRMKFASMQYEKDRLDWQGSQIPYIGFDELTHFTRLQFFYMLSRNRSMCGVRPYVRATCNPDADSWVAEFISWWIDQRTGIAIPERSGVLRWFVRINDKIVWGGSKEALLQQHPELNPGDPKSVTFVPASIYDNKKLLEKDPGYLGNLKALPTVERERLLGGNWKIRAGESGILPASWWKVWTEESLPGAKDERGKPLAPELLAIILSMDCAEKDKVWNDYTAFTAWGLFRPDDADEDDVHAILLRAWREKLRIPVMIERAKEEFESDRWGGRFPDWFVIEDKSAGVGTIQFLQDAGVPVFAYNPGRAGKIERANAVSPILRAGKIWAPGRLLKPGEEGYVATPGKRKRSDVELLPWAQMVVDECEIFPPDPNGEGHDDLVDSCTQAWALMRNQRFVTVPTDKPWDEPEPREPRRAAYG